MRTQEVVYVPVHKNFEERMLDIATQRTREMLRKNGYSTSITCAISMLKDAFGEVVCFECWTKKL